MSSASKGTERQAFIDNFLKEVLPPTFRFGTGEVTDVAGNRSGQLDVVIEYPVAPSLPSALGSPRLYLAESLAAVIEVKSNIASQWQEAIATSNQLSVITRTLGSYIVMGATPKLQIPLFVVGYTGWTTLSTLQNHVDAAPNIDGALIIDQGIFYCKYPYAALSAPSGAISMWCLISALHNITSSLKAVSTEPLDYAK